jgi:membrane protease YdiL (CAAX protease family)
LRHCAYCGAKLDPTFYFCRRCATPYVDESSVLPEVRPQRLFPGRLIREHAPHAMGIFWTYLGVMLGGSILCMFALGEANLPAFFVVMESLLLLVSCVFAVRYGRALASQFVRPGFTRWEAWAGLGALVPLLVLNWAWHRFLTGPIGVESESLTALLREAGFSQGMLVFMICVFPAVTEEIAFRGLVQHWLHVAVQPRQAIVYAAALFTVLHLSVLSAPYLFLVGCLLGWLRWRTGSLWPPIVAHFLHNLGVVLFLDP